MSQTQSNRSQRGGRTHRVWKKRPGQALRNIGGREGAAVELGGKPEPSVSRGGQGTKRCCRVVGRSQRGGGPGIWGGLRKAGKTIFPPVTCCCRSLSPPWVRSSQRPQATCCSSPASLPPSLSAWRSGWACAGSLVGCQQLFLQASSPAAEGGAGDRP